MTSAPGHRRPPAKPPPPALPTGAAPLLPLLLLALALLPQPAAGHGFMVEPAARNFLTTYASSWRWCPHCVNNGGPGVNSGGWVGGWVQAIAWAGWLCRNSRRHVAGGALDGHRQLALPFSAPSAPVNAPPSFFPGLTVQMAAG
jgi:hypothetical protein